MVKIKDTQFCVKNLKIERKIWFLINSTRNQKVVKIKDIHFCAKNLKMKRKKNKIFFWPSGARFVHQIFSNFPAHELNFHGKWGRWDQDKTLPLNNLPYFADRREIQGVTETKPCWIACENKALFLLAN